MEELQYRSDKSFVPQIPNIRKQKHSSEHRRQARPRQRAQCPNDVKRYVHS